MQEQARLVTLESANGNLKGDKAIAQRNADSAKLAADALKKENEGWEERYRLFEKELATVKANRDAQLKAIESANEKELAEQKRFDEQMATQKQHWAKINIDSAKEGRIKQAAVNNQLPPAVELKRAGIETLSVAQARIAEDQRLLNMAEAMLVPLGTQMEMRASILQSEIELGAAQGKNVSDQIIALTKLQAEQDRMQAKSSRKGNLYAGLSAAAGAGSGIIDKANVATVNLIGNGIEGISGALAHAALNGGKFGRVMAQIGRDLAGTALTSVLKIGLQQALKALLNLVPAFGAVAAAQTAAAATSHAATSAINVATVLSYAAVGAAAAAASTAAIPIVGPILAPGVAAATYAQIAALAPLAAFRDGGEPPVGVPSIVGENGPELFVPHQSGKIIPNHQLPGGAGLSLPNAQTIGGSSVSVGGIVINGAQKPRETAREVASYLKSTSSKYQTRG